MEFIYGKQLNLINIEEFEDSDIYMIMFELIISIKYLHDNHFILNDLKQDNVIIDQNKTSIIIDFDHVIKYEDIQQNGEHTKDFSNSAPEVNSGNFSYECDIYSLGILMKYLISKKIEHNERSDKYFIIEEIYQQCLKEKIEDRPSLSKIIEIFDYKIRTQLKINDFNYYTLLSIVNIANAQFHFGIIYHTDKYVPRDINKAIHYISFAADQNFSEAQFKLGVIYSSGEYVPLDINKAINYYLLAANQNHPKAQLNLGIIYYYGEYIPRDINKAIHYISLAANQDDPRAQFFLGSIFLTGKYVTRNISKAIQYYSLAADQNNFRAYFKNL